MARRKSGFFRRLLRRYKKIPKQLRSSNVHQRSRAQRLITLTICIPVMLYCIGYICWNTANRRRIEAENREYQALYATPEPTAIPTAAPTIAPTPTPAPTEAPTIAPMPTIEPTAAPQVVLQIHTQEDARWSPEATQLSPMDTPTFAVAMDDPIFQQAEDEPIAAAEPTAISTPSPTPAPTPIPVPTPSPTPRATADADTLVYALETPPPVQESFQALLARNPETVGYIRIGEEISLPVVQRKNDNDYYLNHNFDGEDSNGGTLFLDGSNLLVPEDMNLIVYGHNMKNGTMFRPLTQYADMDFLKTHGTVYFDTIYQNRAYVPFAVLTASMEPDSDSYINIRKFLFEPDEFDAYVSRLQALSIYDMEVDVRYGDSILLLVTCEYTHNSGRFMVALRAVRDDETEIQMNELSRYAKRK